jgi:trimeric autotransporter adhesin
MATINTVTDEYVLRPTIDDQASAGIDKLAAKLGAFEQVAGAAATAAGAVASQISDAGGRISEATTQFDRFAKKYDEVTQAAARLALAQKELQQAQDAGQRALANGTATQAQYDATTAGLAEKVARLATALGAARAEATAHAEAQAAWNGEIGQGAAAAQAFAERVAASGEITRAASLAIAEWQQATTRAASAQAAFNQVLGVADAQQQQQSTAQRAADVAAYGNALDDLRAKYNPVFAASRQYETELAGVSDALAKGAITSDEAAAATERVTAAYAAANQPLGGAVKASQTLTAENNNAAFATRQLAVQSVQFFSSIESGAPVLLSFIQQGHQVLDVALATGTGFGVVGTAIKSAWGAISSFVVANPALVALTALTAASTALLVVTQNTEAKLHTLQQQIRGTSDDYMALGIAATAAAKAVAATSNIGSADASAAASAFSQAAGFAGSGLDLPALIKMAGDASVALGVSIPDAAKKFAGAILDAGTLAQEFADKHLFRVDEEFARSIKLQVEGGDTLGAYSRVLAQVTSASKDSLAPATDLGKAWQQLTAAFTGASQGGKSLATVLGDAVAAWATTAIHLVHDVVDAVNWARGQIAANDSRLGAPAATPGGQAGPQGVLASSQGALGLGQLMPATATELGVDPTRAADNIKGVFLYLNKLATLTDNFGNTLFPDQASVANAYNRGPGAANPTNVGAYSRSVAAARSASLPSDTADLIDAVGASRQASATLIDFVKRLVVVESGGNQYFKGVGLAPPGGASASAAAPAPSAPSAPSAQQLLIDQAQKLTTAGNVPVDSAATAAAQVELLTKALSALGERTSANATQFDSFHERLDQANKALYDAVTPTDALTRSTGKEIAAQQELATAWGQGLTQVQQINAANLAKTQIDQHLAVGTDAYNLAVAKQTVLNEQLIQTQASSKSAEELAATERQTEATKAITAAIQAGLPAQALAIAQEAARARAIANGLTPGTEAYTKAVDAATQANLKAAEAAGQQTIEQSIVQTDRATAAQTRIAAAYKQSYEAVAQATAAAEAEAQLTAQKLTPANDNYNATLQRLTATILAKAAADAQVATGATVQGIDEQIRAQTELADAYAHGYGAVAQLSASEQARAQALQAKLIPGQTSYILGVIQLTGENLKLAREIERTKAASETLDYEGQVKFITAETTSLGMNADARTLYLAHIQNEIAVRKDYALTFDKVGQKMIAERDSLDAMKLAYQQHEAALSYLSQQFSTAFDTIGNAMAQAFVQGQGAAVNWRNVMSAVAQQVIQAFLKLALLNPLLNSLFNQNNQTLSSVVSALGSGGSTSVGGSAVGGSSLTSSGGLLSNLNSLYSAGKSLFNGTGTVSPFIDNLATSYLPAGVFETLPATSPAFAALPEGVSGPVAEYGASLAGTTLSNAVTGVGAGFAAGSLVGGFEQSALGKTGPAPTIGAGVGSVAGAAIGTFVLPVIGTVAGGIIGGIIGGAGGGLIGPHVASPYSLTDIGLADGRLTLGQSLNQRDASNRVATSSDIDTLNNYLTASGTAISSLGLLQQVGAGGQMDAANPGGFADKGKFTDLASAFSQLRFSASSNADLNSVLKDRSFTGLPQLQDVVDFISKTVPALVALGTPQATTGSLVTTLNTLNTEFSDAITKADGLGRATTDLSTAWDSAVKQAQDAVAAVINGINQGLEERDQAATARTPFDQQSNALFAFDAKSQPQRDALSAQLVSIYGDSIKSTQGYADQMALLEKTLGDERLAIIKSSNAQIVQAQMAVTANDNAETGRYLTAYASVSGNATDAASAQLFNFDVSAQQQRTALSTQLIALYGDTITATAGYADEMRRLEKTLGEERLALVKSTNAQIAAATTQAQGSATQFVTALRTYVTGLSQGSNSVLSPLAKLNAAQATFDTTASQARSGNATAMTALQTTSDALITAARAYYGSSSGYVGVFNQVIDAIQNVAEKPADTLTASFLALQTQTQTTTLVEQLEMLRAEVAGLRADVNRGAATPLRIAA